MTFIPTASLISFGRRPALHRMWFEVRMRRRRRAIRVLPQCDYCWSLDRRNRDRAAPAMSVVASMRGANYRESILSRSVLASRLCPFRGLLAVNLVWI